MEKERCFIVKQCQQIQQILEKYKQVFTPTEKELHVFANRLRKYNREELKNLNENFEQFGVREVLNCIYKYLAEYHAHRILRMSVDECS